jgi:hypothetical protein
MSDFKNRLEIEKQELDEKIEKLTIFVVSPNFDKIDIKQQELLDKQLPVMCEYRDILTERLALLN